LTRLCSKCGRQVRDNDAVFCPYCATSLPSAPGPYMKRTGFPVAAGILIIIGACAAVVSGLIGIYVYFWYLRSSYYYHYFEWFITGFFGILGFAFGLTAGIFSLKRKLFPLSMIGMCLVLISGLVTIGNFATIQSSNSWMTGLLFGLPPTILAILSVIFAAVSHKEFV